LSQKTIANHIAQNMPWIADRLKRVAMVEHNLVAKPSSNVVDGTSTCDNAILSNQIVKDIFAGKCILLCGQVYSCNASTNAQTHLQDDCLYIADKHFATRELRLKAIKTFLKRMSGSVLSQEVSKWGSYFALCPTKIQFKDLHGRWCSCADAEQRAIVLDYRLIQLPQRLQEYVIAHAFAHFAKSGHANDYFEHLACYIRDYKDRQKAIADYDFLLDV
jgi:predicted metal-dependent hydrolase